MRKDKRLTVTKTFLPPILEYEKYLRRIWLNHQLTNQGPLLEEFEDRLSSYLRVRNLHFVANGTLSLQLALRALSVTEGEVITTPFSYVATTSAIMWEHCKPVFVDIDPDTLNINPSKIEAKITPKTKAILAVHVFGNPCDTEKIENIAKKHNLKVIYDGAHAFGVKYKGKSLLKYGDISTCSFHATKLFHTIEGGCIVSNDKSISNKIELIKRFGHNGDDHIRLGINAKASEFSAAMGLCNLEYIDKNIATRKSLAKIYDQLLESKIQRLCKSENTEYNYGYYPVILEDEDELVRKIKLLNKENIFPRRYFYPSLNKLPYIKDPNSCPISEDISRRVMCLPLYSGLTETDVNKVCRVLLNA